MRVALNALCITNRSGTGRYTAGLLEGLARLRPSGLELTAFIPSDFSPPSLWRHEAWIDFHPVSVSSLLKRIAWEQWTLPGLLRSLQADLLHSPAFIGPVLRPCPVPQIVTIHDLAFRRYPETIPWIRKLYYRWAIPRSMRRAALILTDTRAVAEELCAPAVSAPIVPVHLGVDTNRFHSTPNRDDEEFLRMYDVHKPYILFVGTQEPRKNLSTLLEAYFMAREWGLESELVLMGRYGWSVERSVFKQVGIRRIGYIDEAHQPALYRQAAALAAPSLYEGFDLPAYEALACATPVIASDIAVHRETLGERARFIPALDAVAWARALHDKESLSKTVGFRARDWIDTARETVEAWRKCG